MDILASRLHFRRCEMRLPMHPFPSLTCQPCTHHPHHQSHLHHHPSILTLIISIILSSIINISIINISIKVTIIVTRDFFGYYWLFCIFWLLMVISGYLWLFLTISDSFWLFLTISGYFWLFLTISDYF